MRRLRLERGPRRTSTGSRTAELAERVLARRHGEQLLAEMSSAQEARPRRDASAVSATVLALLMHGVTLALAVLGGPRSTRDAMARADELWGRLTAFAASIPEYEYERQRRAGARRGHQVDTTHPPTHLRRAGLLGGETVAAVVVPQARRSEQIAAELAKARAEVARCLLRDGFAD
ncbi:hypothetical protein ACFC00_16325 [Streptomyces adustus]|uniref:hypothetical protein n=1 Tax=Streptomyces adustus TaxID=1609272 RepID=UPI0035E126A1